MNKNLNCSIDKKIQELESEIKRLCPKEDNITIGTLSQAVRNLHSMIRNRGMSASQIHFSSDTNFGQNLYLDDKKLIDDKICKRSLNYPLSAKSKAPAGTKPLIVKEITPGHIVYAMNVGSKHVTRDPLLVTGVDGSKVRVQKIIHSHSTSEKSRKICSDKITTDPKFLYVSPHRR